MKSMRQGQAQSKRPRTFAYDSTVEVPGLGPVPIAIKSLLSQPALLPRGLTSPTVGFSDLDPGPASFKSMRDLPLTPMDTGSDLGQVPEEAGLLRKTKRQTQLGRSSIDLSDVTPASPGAESGLGVL